MPTLNVLDPSGKPSGTLELKADVFGVEVRVPLLHQAVTRELADRRAGTHDTKGRSEVSGGGRKPWKQKGTGRARQGSSRSPQWTGGGVVHGPHPRDHGMRVNKKMKRGALRSALTDALRSEKLVVLKDLVLDEPKTKAAAQLLDALEIEGGKVLVVLPAPSDTGAVEKSFRNIQGVRVSYAKSLGVYEIVAADRLVLTTAALDVLEGSPEEGTPTEAGAAQAAGTTTREAGEDA